MFRKLRLTHVVTCVFTTIRHDRIKTSTGSDIIYIINEMKVVVKIVFGHGVF